MHIYNIFLILAIILAILETGLFPLSLKLNINILKVNFGTFKFRFGVSLASIALLISWFTGLQKVCVQFANIPTVVALVIICIVLPTLFATLFEKES